MHTHTHIYSYISSCLTFLCPTADPKKDTQAIRKITPKNPKTHYVGSGSGAIYTFSEGTRFERRAVIAQWVQQLATGWTVLGSNPGGG